MGNNQLRSSIAVLALGLSSTVHAAFVGVFGAANANQWFDAAVGFSTIAFTGLPEGTQVTEQYASQGIHFHLPPWGTGNLVQASEVMYPQDGWGLLGAEVIKMTFDTPMSAFAAYFPGSAEFEFYSGATFLYSRLRTGDINNFAGFTSSQSFDRVMMRADEPVNFGVFADNVYFSPVPAPSVLALAAVAGVSRRARRGRA